MAPMQIYSPYAAGYGFTACYRVVQLAYCLIRREFALQRPSDQAYGLFLKNRRRYLWVDQPHLGGTRG